MRSLLAILIALVCCQSADACNRCGLFGNRCRYVATSTYVAPAAVVAAPTNVYVVQNSYPQPIVGQGTSAVVGNGGYQSLALPLFDPSQYFSQSLQLTLNEHLLQRRQDTPAQQQLSAAQRRRNLRQAFQLAPDGQVKGLHLAVVDDVLTTGATAESITRLLRKAGAARVDVYCLARTPKPGD